MTKADFTKIAAGLHDAIVTAAKERSSRTYIALLHKDEASDYSVSFPDFPGCSVICRTIDAARIFAEEVLALHVQGIIDAGEMMPEPSSLESVMADPASQGADMLRVRLAT